LYRRMKPSWEDRNAQRIHLQKINAAKPTIPTHKPSRSEPRHNSTPRKEDGKPPASRRASSGKRAQSSQSALRPRPPDITDTHVYNFLKVFCMHQYATQLVELGIVDLNQISQLSDADVLAALDKIHIVTGHRLQLMQALDRLRLGTSMKSEPSPGLSAENARLTTRIEELSENNKLLQQTNESQANMIEGYRVQLAELEELVKDRTEQMQFLMWQLQQAAQAEPQIQESIFQSCDAWGKLKPPVEDHLLCTSDDQVIIAEPVTRAPENEIATRSVGGYGGRPREAPKKSCIEDPVGVGHRQLAYWGVPDGDPRSGRFGVAQSLDAAAAKESLGRFSVDRVVRCLATAVQTHIVMALKAARPHRCQDEEILEQCTVFLEENSHAMLMEQAALNLQQSTQSTCSVFNSVTGLRPATACSLLHPLNAVAKRSIVPFPDIYGFLRNVMVAFRLQPEVSVICLFYLERFMDKTGVAVTPDNWQRLCITAMMLASKVWDDESFENYDFAALCPLYSLDEINAFERTFLKVIAYNVSVKGSDYAKTYFVLRTLGAVQANEDGEEFLEPIDESRAAKLQLGSDKLRGSLPHGLPKSTRG